MISLLFIVNGEDVPITALHEDQISDARDDALRISHNTGRPLEDWEIRTDTGALVPPSTRVLCFPNARLFLTLRVGVGGNLGSGPFWGLAVMRHGTDI